AIKEVDEIRNAAGFAGGGSVSLSINALVLHSEYFGERSCRQRLPEEEALHLSAAPVEQVGELLLRLHSFSYDTHVETFGHGDHCLHDRRVVGAANHVVNEIGGDLDRVHRKLLQIAERAPAAAEIV